MTKESQKTNTMTAEETARQNSFIELAKTLTAQKSNTLGRPLTYCLTTFGCQMNEKQSEVVAGIMDEIGYHRQDNEEADVVIYNTCTVRENANLKVYGRLGHLHSLKDKNPDMKIILFGCMMQEPHVVEKIKKTYPFVNLVFGTHNIFKFAELFYDMQQSEQQIVDIWEGTDQIVEDLPTERNYTFKSGVNIMFGCNNFCSYCIVPYVRGRERSREPGGNRQGSKTSGSGRRFRSHASWTECKLLWQDTGESGYFCTASGNAGRYRGTQKNPFHDFPSEGSFR